MSKHSIWRQRRTPAEINRITEDSMVSHLDIRITDIDESSVAATMPVDGRTRQPYGLLHGGASVALAETLASVAGTLAVEEDQMVVGVEVNANHLRQARAGTVTGRATPLHLGGRIQVWQVEIEDDSGRLVCISRVTLAVLERPQDTE